MSDQVDKIGEVMQSKMNELCGTICPSGEECGFSRVDASVFVNPEDKGVALMYEISCDKIGGKCPYEVDESYKSELVQKAGQATLEQLGLPHNSSPE